MPVRLFFFTLSTMSKKNSRVQTVRIDPTSIRTDTPYALRRLYGNYSMDVVAKAAFWLDRMFVGNSSGFIHTFLFQG